MDTKVADSDVILDVAPDTTVDIPQRGDFVPCDAKECRQRSYFFYLLNMGSLLSYCAHHGREYFEKLDAISEYYFDYSDDLEENRLKGDN